MKKNLSVLLVLIFSIIVFESCSDDDNENKEISVSRFELGEPYKWNLSKGKDAVYIINDYTEMQKYVESVDGTKPTINTPDFDKYSLVLASGPTANGVSKIETKLIKHNDKNYTFEISVFTNETAVAEGYIVAVTTPKLANNVTVGKRVIIQH